jgi:hypothetical protein
VATSDVAICKLALAHVGATVILASINPPDGSAASERCAAFYPVARQELLESHSWSFAKKRVALALLSDNPSDVWTYAYAKPTNLLKPKRILTAGVLALSPLIEEQCWGASTTFKERESAEYEIEGDVVLTHEPDAVMIYLADVVDVSKYTAGFTSALALLLGSYLAGPMVKGNDGVALGLKLRQAYDNVAARAKASDANSSTESSEFIPASLRRRS